MFIIFLWLLYKIYRVLGVRVVNMDGNNYNLRLLGWPSKFVPHAVSLYMTRSLYLCYAILFLKYHFRN